MTLLASFACALGICLPDMFGFEVNTPVGLLDLNSLACTFVDLIITNGSAGSKTFTDLDGDFQLMWLVIAISPQARGTPLPWATYGTNPTINWGSHVTASQILVFAK